MKIWILLISVLSIFAESKKGILLTQDRAVFRMETTVFMLSDLKDYLKNVNVLRCFSRKSYLLDTLQLGRAHLKRIPSYRQLNDNLAQHEAFLAKLLKMIKMESFANQQKIDTGAGFHAKLGIGGCVSKDWKKWSVRFKSLVHTELFLRDRYGVGKKTKKQMELFLQTMDKKFGHNLFF